MSQADEVRLWRWGGRWREQPISPAMPKPVQEEQYIAVRAAKHAALMRVVDAAVAAAPDWLPDDIGAATEAVVANAQRIALGLVRLGRAITAPAPGRQGEAARACPTCGSKKRDQRFGGYCLSGDADCQHGHACCHPWHATTPPPAPGKV